MRYSRVKVAAAASVFVACMLASHSPLLAQKPACAPWPHTACSIAEVLEQFALDARSRGLEPSEWGESVAMSILTQWGEIAPARTDSLLDGLERLALAGSNEYVRQSAASTILFSVPERPGTAARLLRIYRRSPDPLVRSTIASASIRLRERALLIPLLKELATQDESNEDFTEASWVAVSVLLHMDEEGRQALRELHASGRARGKGRAQLDRIARHDFRDPLSPPRPSEPRP